MKSWFYLVCRVYGMKGWKRPQEQTRYCACTKGVSVLNCRGMTVIQASKILPGVFGSHYHSNLWSTWSLLVVNEHKDSGHQILSTQDFAVPYDTPLYSNHVDCKKGTLAIKLWLTDDAQLFALLCVCPATVGVGGSTIYKLGTCAVWEDTQGAVLGLLWSTGVHWGQGS